MATPDGQHLHDERAGQREVVRRLCPMGGEHARPPVALSRALMPRDPLLTLCGGLVWQENALNCDLPPILVNLLTDDKLALDHCLLPGGAAAGAGG